MDRTTAVELIEHLLSEHGHLTGSRLSSLLREADPAWTPVEHGVQTLGAFIGTFVTNVVEVGRSGLDPIYCRATDIASQALSAGNIRSAHDLWRIWASPNSVFVLEVNLVDGEVRASSRKSPQIDGWGRILSPDANAHRDLARDFVVLQFPEGDATLSAFITEDASWWVGWFKQIKQRKLTRVWNEFRRARLFAAFEHSLSSLGLSPGAQSLSLSSMRRWANPGVDLQQALAQRTTPSGVNELRNIAALAIEDMSDDELSELRLPLGLVLRAIKRIR
jgi:hypothetical protein